MMENDMSRRKELRLTLAAGMTEHLTKPLDPDSVYRMLVKFCRKAG